jgi:AcrR family transcriptional regulator
MAAPRAKARAKARPKAAAPRTRTPRTASPRKPAPRKPSGKRATFHHGDLRRALVQAALELVAQAQDDSFTLREAARRVGVNHRAVYHHFADKRALLVAVAIDGWRGLFERIRDVLDDQPTGASLRQRLLAIGQTYVGYALDHPAHYRVMYGPRLNVDGRFPELEAVLQETMAFVSDELRRGIERGELPASRDLTQSMLTLWAAVHGVAHLVLERRIQVRAALVPLYVEVLLRPTVEGLTL